MVGALGSIYQPHPRAFGSRNRLPNLGRFRPKTELLRQASAPRLPAPRSSWCPRPSSSAPRPGTESPGLGERHEIGASRSGDPRGRSSEITWNPKQQFMDGVANLTQNGTRVGRSRTSILVLTQVSAQVMFPCVKNLNSHILEYPIASGCLGFQAVSRLPRSVTPALDRKRPYFIEWLVVQRS